MFEYFKGFLEKNNIWHEFLIRGDMKRADSAAKSAGIKVDDIAKSLLFKVGNDFWLVIIQGSRKVSTKKLRILLEEENVCLASPEEVLDITGFPVGAVPPIGLKNKVKCIMDKDVSAKEKVWAGGGAADRLVHLKVEDIVNYSKPRIEDVKE